MCRPRALAVNAPAPMSRNTAPAASNPSVAPRLGVLPEISSGALPPGPGAQIASVTAALQLEMQLGLFVPAHQLIQARLLLPKQYDVQSTLLLP